MGSRVMALAHEVSAQRTGVGGFDSYSRRDFIIVDIPFQKRFDSCPEPDIPANGRVSTTNGLGLEQAIYYSCIQGIELVGLTKRMCEAASTWSGTEPTCLIPMFPDILLAFGSILILLVIVDVFVIGVCVYYRYCRNK
ncbi:hypothetical protein DPMN_078742, partial [Dreissena polymorpha]